MTEEMHGLDGNVVSMDDIAKASPVLYIANRLGEIMRGELVPVHGWAFPASSRFSCA